MTNPGRVLVGAALVVAGALILADQAGFGDAGTVIGRGWPVLIVAFGLLQVSLDPAARTAGVFLVAIGLGLLAVTSGVVGRDALRFALPAALLALGAWVLLGRPSPQLRSERDDTVHFLVAFAARRVAATSPVFAGGSASVFFGSGNLDLRQAVPTADGARVGATVLFGNLYVVVPEGWRITMRGFPILGGWDDTTRKDGIPEGAPRLTVGGLVMFGGLEIRHAERWS